MIRRLRIKFLAMSLTAVLLLLVFLLLGIHLANWHNVVSRADVILSLLAENRGSFPAVDSMPDPTPPPEHPEGWKDPESEKSPPPPQKEDPDAENYSWLLQHFPELAYDTRYFWVLFDGNGKVLTTDLSHVVAVNSETALAYADEARLAKDSGGFIGVYRYLVVNEAGQTRVIFLDCHNRISAFWTFVSISITIGLAGYILLSVLLILFSRRAIRPLVESDERQKRFVTDASHELKTPLTIINAHAELLEMELGEHEALNEIRNQSHRLAELTNELISLARMEENTPHVLKIDFPFSDVVLDTVEKFRSVAATGGQTLSVDITPMLSLNGDSRAIERLISVLLENALKYTPRGGEIQVSLKKKRTSLILTVTNPSPHRPHTKELEHLFDRFYRPDTSRTSSTGGYGIGLSIAKAIVLAHGGKIHASLPDDLHFCITVTLPLRK